MGSGIVIDIDPVIVHLGPFMLRWFSLFFGLAVLAGVIVGIREAGRLGIPRQAAERVALWSVVGGIVAARLFHVIDRWPEYAADPMRIPMVWNGGLAVYGGLIGGVATALAVALWTRIPAWRLADAAAPAMVLGQGLGRLACIPNGDAPGAPAALPWSFTYTHPDAMVPPELRGVPLHPYAVYELLFDLALFALLWRARKHPALERRPGLLFVLYAAVYSAGRFALTFYRIEREWAFGLQQAQVLSLAGLALALLLGAVLLFRGPSRDARPAPAGA